MTHAPGTYRCGARLPIDYADLVCGREAKHDGDHRCTRGDGTVTGWFDSPAPPGPGVWVAFNWDGSAFVPFASELEALRHASSYHMPVKFVQFGDDEWMRK